MYTQDVDLNAAVQEDPFPKVTVDFDNVLGLEDSSETTFLSYQWRYSEKWSLQVYYSQFEGEGEKRATRDFNYDGEEYTAGALLESEFNLDTILVSTSYSFVRDSSKEFGLGFGLHAFDIETSISAEVGLQGIHREGTRVSEEVLAPLPNLRVYGTYMITPKWEVQATAGWLSFSYDDYDGDYLFVTFITEYRITDHFGLGVAYQIAEIDVEFDDSKSSNEFNFDLYGPSVFLGYGF